MKSALMGAAAVALLGVLPSHATAGTVTGTLGAQYYEVLTSSDADFSGGPGFTGSSPVVMAGSSLGPDGLPVGAGVNDLNGAGEITWWSPTQNSNVHPTGSGSIALPFSSTMFAPNSTGSNDSTYYETAVFDGSFSLSADSPVTFNLGSDDDAFVYVDGSLFGQNPGIHATTSVSFTSPSLSAGSHQIEVFYADREQVAAQLNMSLDAASANIVLSPPVSAAPEPAAWALMLGGVAMIGGAMRVARRRQGLAAA